MQSSTTPDWLYALQCQYFQLVPHRKIFWDSLPPLDMAQQEAILDSTLLHPLAKTHPPSTQYSLRFLKNLMDRAEAQGHEQSEASYELYVSLLSATSTSSDPCSIGYSGGRCYKSYPVPLVAGADGSNQLHRPTQWISLLEEEAIISRGTTGLRTWEGALRLAEYLTANPQVVRGRRVLELGAGAGLVGFVSAALGASNVELTDVDSDVLNLLRENSEINSHQLLADGLCIPQVSRLDWESVDVTEVNARKADLVLCADVVYDPSLVPPLVNVILMLLSGGAREVIIASTLRHQTTVDLFTSSLLEAGVQSTRLALDNVPQVFFHEEDVVILLQLQLSSNILKI